MTDLTIEHQNEIIVNCLLSAAGYFTRDKKQLEEKEKMELNPHLHLRKINQQVNDERLQDENSC
jgi:hypothetical protein